LLSSLYAPLARKPGRRGGKPSGLVKLVPGNRCSCVTHAPAISAAGTRAPPRERSPGNRCGRCVLEEVSSMSQRVSTGTVTAIIVVVVIVLGIIAWKVLGGRGAPSQAETQSQQQLEMQSHAQMQRGGTG